MLELNLSQQKLLGGSTFKSKLYFLIPVFIAAVIIGFFIELIFFERISLQRFSEKFKDTYLLSQSQYESEESTYFIAKQQESINEDLKKNTKVGLLAWKDDHTLLDIENFSFVVNNKSICRQLSDILLVLVSSERNHFNERRVIRRTYGSLSKLEDFNIRLIFLLGITPEKTFDANPFDMDNETMYSLLDRQNLIIREENELISNESFLYGDLVIGNFIESQSNLSYKHLMAYKWVLNFCPSAKYVFKLDDNVFVNFHKLLAQNKLSTDFICRMFDNDNQCPDCTSIARVYNLEKSLKFCPAWFYGVNVDWIYKIYSVSQKYPFLVIDDVFVTGVLRQKAENNFDISSTISDINVTIYDDRNSDMCSLVKSNNVISDLMDSVSVFPKHENLSQNFVCLWNYTETINV